jgi:adenylate cyclase
MAMERGWRLLRRILRSPDRLPVGRAAVLALTWLSVGASLLANVVGVAVIALLFLFVLPLPTGVDAQALLEHNGVALTLYVLGTSAVGVTTVARRTASSLRWLAAGRPPKPDERAATLALPRRMTTVSFPLWVLGAVIFTIHNARLAGELATMVASTLVIGGAVTMAVAYLLNGRVIRPATTRALLADPPTEVRRPGVALRTMVVWALGTGLPLLGIAGLGVRAWWTTPDPRELALAIMVLSLVAVAAGLLTMILHARALADPLRALRKALARVEQGDFGAEMPIYDVSELGIVQAGFNQMVVGLRERERVRDLFGRHVGEDVARRALASEVELGGEERFVAALFVDVVGSTAITEQLPPSAVVDELNRFFGVVVTVVDEHGGLVNKFEGDAALCIWGAPLRHPQPATAALVTARTMAARFAQGASTFEVAIGVSAGSVVAGNIGDPNRLEYTVIGDPVNEAARLTKLAKQHQGRVLASGDAVTTASSAEAARWQPAGEATLRGRTTPTALYVPLEE